ncbi:MAG TPA: 3D domain-containing protein [Bryobacteraceae bacterium]|nr:3D domain-containing protein [Bryobacteraceae bacterium]
MKYLLSFLMFVFLSTVAFATGTHPRANGQFLATAYAQTGITRSGKPARRGFVAADPRVLPLGTKVLVSNAGPYSGTYTVADTGAKVRGRHIDIFMPSVYRAREFGRKMVQVKVLAWGEG